MGVLVLVVLLFVIMPGLLYLIGWSAKRFTKPTKASMDTPVVRKGPTE